MKVCIHRGTQEIGGTCIEVESAGQRIVLDVGLPLNADRDVDAKSLLPDVKGFVNLDDSLLAALISHPHQDHFGLASFLPPQIPIIIGEAAHNILRSATFFTPSGADFEKTIYLKDGETINIGPFEIMPYLVDHSAYDAYSILISANGKRLFYSGDFRAHGRKAKLFQKMIKNPPKDIDVLLMEGTTIGRGNPEDKFQTEDELIPEFAGYFDSTQGLCLAWCSGQNIDRLVTIYKACKAANRQFIIDLYTAEILRATGNPSLPQGHWEDIRVFLPKSQKYRVIEQKLFDISNQYRNNRIYPENLSREASQSVMLFRPSMSKDLDATGCLNGASLVYSIWEGYLKMDQQKPFLDWLETNQISMKKIHTSGHASISDLKDFSKALNSKKLIPIHSFETDQFPDFFTNVELKEDGKWWEVEK
jgi:ribonuclease J